MSIFFLIIDNLLFSNIFSYVIFFINVLKKNVLLMRPTVDK